MLIKLLSTFVYNLFSLFKKQDKNKFVIVLSRSKVLEDNLEFVYKEIISSVPQAKVYLVIGENKMNFSLFREIAFLADAQFLILDDYYLPIYLIKPSKQLKVIQLWHAAGAFKKFGYSTVGKKFGPEEWYLKLIPIHSNYTHVYVSAEKFVKFYAEAFNMSREKVFPIGVPRIDLFRDKERCHDLKGRLYLENPELKKDVIKILFAPTYRANGKQVESTFNDINILSHLSSTVKDNIIILYKPHPYIEGDDISKLESLPNVLVVKGHTINEWMTIADAFITDYSSSIIEFSLLKRPLAHFVPDIEEYSNNRGFYQKIQDFSDGEILRTYDELIYWINSRKVNESFDTSRMIEYNFDNVESVPKKIVRHFL